MSAGLIALDWILIPLYNEAGTVARVLDGLKTALGDRSCRILIIDDGSGDGSGEQCAPFLDDPRIELMRFDSNRGPKEVFRVGMNWVLERAGDFGAMAVVEADNTNDLSILPLMLDMAASGEADLVCASRYLPRSENLGVAAYRDFLSRAINSCVGLLFPSVRSLTDITVFYKAYGIGALRRAMGTFEDDFFQGRGFFVSPAIVILMTAMGLKALEIPQRYDYNQKSGESKLKVVPTVKEYISGLPRLRKIIRRRLGSA